MTIKHIEYQIAERALREGWVQPLRPAEDAPASGRWRSSAPGRPAWPPRSSSPAPATTTVLFEKDDRLGGLLRYGIPDFKLEKHVLDRRLAQMAAEGVKFEPGVDVGDGHLAAATCAGVRRRLPGMGAGEPRPLDVPGADLPGVHFAMDFLTQQNRRVAGDARATATWREIMREGQARGGRRRRRHGQRLRGHVDPPGGRLGHPIRNPAAAAGRPQSRDPLALLAQDHADLQSSHEEGCQRRWSMLTKALLPARRPRRAAPRLRQSIGSPGPQGLADEGVPGTDSPSRPTWC